MAAQNVTVDSWVVGEKVGFSYNGTNRVGEVYKIRPYDAVTMIIKVVDGKPEYRTFKYDKIKPFQAQQAW